MQQDSTGRQQRRIQKVAARDVTLESECLLTAHVVSSAFIKNPPWHFRSNYTDCLTQKEGGDSGSHGFFWPRSLDRVQSKRYVTGSLHRSFASLRMTETWVRCCLTRMFSNLPPCA